MAEKHWNSPDDINQVLYLRPDSPKGYKREYLLQSLSEMEEQFIICPSCEGIMRDASTYEGQTTCNLCSENISEAKAVKQVRTLVAKLEIKCPLLRDCDWTGQLTECDEHFSICASALLLCPVGCDGVFGRSQIEDHLKNGCPLRKVNCNFCSNNFQFKDLKDHIGICPDQPINCECGAVIHHSRKEVHFETECPLAEVECPYAKYSCRIGSIQRKDLLAHKKEFYIEHQDMLEERCLQLEERNTILEEKHTKLAEQYHIFGKENFELKKALQSKKDLDNVDIKIIFNLKKPKLEAPEFSIGYSVFTFLLSGTEPIRISIRGSPSMTPSMTPLMTPLMTTFMYIPFCECYLLLDPTSLFNESYFEVFKFNLNFGGMAKECVLSLDKSIYSNYLQEDGTLLMRLYFA